MEILDEIGEGGFGIVKKARDLINNEMTAIKIIDSKSMNFDKVSTDLKNAESIQQQQHQGIFKMFLN